MDKDNLLLKHTKNKFNAQFNLLIPMSQTVVGGFNSEVQSNFQAASSKLSAKKPNGVLCISGYFEEDD